MKYKALIISLLLGNIVLLCVLVLMVLRPAREGKEHRVSVPAASRTHEEHSAAATAMPPPTTSDLVQIISQLRAARASESLLVRLVEADFAERWEELRGAMQKRFEEGEIDEATLAGFYEQRETEQEKELRLFLGDAAFEQWDQKRELADLRRLNLTTEESGAVYQLKKGFQRQQSDLSRRLRNGAIDNTDFTELLAGVQKDYDNQMEELLGRERYATHQYFGDETTTDLRRALRTLNTGDDQFAALLEAQRKWNERRATLAKEHQNSGAQDGDYIARIQAIDAERDKDYRQVLGTDGLALLNRQQDHNYRTLKHYATAWQLNDWEIDQLYATLQDYNRIVANYRQNARNLDERGWHVDWSAINDNIREHARQTEREFQLYLGGDRFLKIQRNGILNLSASLEEPANPPF